MSIILGAVTSLAAFSIISASLSVISLWFGYWKKSPSVTLVTGIIILSIFGNFSTEILLSGGRSQNLITIAAAAVSVLVSLALITRLSKKVSSMEV